MAVARARRSAGRCLREACRAAVLSSFVTHVRHSTTVPNVSKNKILGGFDVDILWGGVDAGDIQWFPRIQVQLLS